MPNASLEQERRFSGTLRSEHHQCSITFAAKIDSTGEVQFDFDELPLTDNTSFILHSWYGAKRYAHRFSLDATSEDEISFETNRLYFNSIGPISDSIKGHFYVLKGYCSFGKFRRKAEKICTRPQLTYWMKGFECFRPLHFVSSLGTVLMTGALDPKNINELTGALKIRAENEPGNVSEWHSSSDELLEYVRRLMSFAAGVDLHAPVSEFRSMNDIEVSVWSCSEQHRARMSPIHRLDRKAFFEASVNSFSDPRIKIHNLNFAIEWFCMDAAYSEVRLVNAMTALENLIDSNLDASEQLHLTKSQFRGLQENIRTSVKEFTRKNFDEKASSSLALDICAKIPELNRRTLEKKFIRLSTNGRFRHRISKRESQIQLPRAIELFIKENITRRELVTRIFGSTSW